MTQLYAAITKVDPESRIVEGYASTEALDSQGERVSRGAIEGALADYMKFGNIREMHQPSAVGKTKMAEMDAKGLKISVKVVDDAAWKKVKEGVYNGFSIGGSATHKVDNCIEAMTLTEISLVDRPACPEALITLWKADTTMIKTKADVGKALQAIAQANLQKACGLSNLAQLASTVESLSWVIEGSEWERQYEGDNSQVPAMLREGYKILAEAMKAMATEETDEAAAEQARQAAQTDAMIGSAAPVAVALMAKAEDAKEEAAAAAEAEAAAAAAEKAKADESAAAAAPKEKEAPAGGEEDPDKAKADEEAAAAAAAEKAKADEAAAAPARSYSDEDKLALKAVYRMMKESGILEDLKAEDAAAAPAAPAEGEEDPDKAKADEEAAAAAAAEKAKADEEAAAATAAKEKEAPAGGEDPEKAKADEEASAAAAKEEEAAAEKLAKAIGMGAPSKDTAILKAAGFSSAADAVDAITKAAGLITKLNAQLEAVKKLPAMTKGVLRVIDRMGTVQEVTPADLIAKGEKPVDVLAKILSGEVDSGTVTKYQGFQNPPGN